jgi:hypothetical protein
VTVMETLTPMVTPTLTVTSIARCVPTSSVMV